MKKLKKKT